MRTLHRGSVDVLGRAVVLVVTLAMGLGVFGLAVVALSTVVYAVMVVGLWIP
jgi:hypothetical protein